MVARNENNLVVVGALLQSALQTFVFVTVEVKAKKTTRYIVINIRNRIILSCFKYLIYIS